MRLNVMIPKCYIPVLSMVIATCGYSQTNPIPYLPIESFGIYSATLENEPEFLKTDALHSQTRILKQQAVSPAIDDELHHAVALLPAFSWHLYSGCDDRAHATSMLLLA